jgi:hypothetical protein
MLQSRSRKRIAMRFYVIMPVGSDKLFNKKRAIIQSEARKADLIAYFPLDGMPDKLFDLDSVIHDLQDSQFVIADLSLERPSCYFELGLAQAVGMPTHLIAEERTPIHQSSGQNQIRFYRDLDEYRILISQILIETASVDVSAIA